MKKKLSMLLSLLMCAVMIFSLGAAVLAADGDEAPEEPATVALKGEYYLHSTNYSYGEEVDSVEIKLEKELDPETVANEDFEFYTMSRNRKSQRTILSVAVEGTTVTVNVGRTGSGVNTGAGSKYYIDLVGEVKDKDGVAYNADEFTFAGQINPAIDQFIEGETEHMKYRLFVPETEGKKPLIVWLHGGGEFGTDNRIHLAASNPTNYAKPEYQAIFGEAGAYVLAPQSPEPKPHLTSNIMETIYDVIEKYDVDMTRIYVMGCSQGGKTTSMIVSEYPYFFAGAISNCPWQYQISEEAAKNLTDLPIIFFHATNDTTAWPYESIESCRRLREAGSETAWCCFYSRNPDNPVTGRAMMGHWSWTWLHENPTTTEEYFIDGEGVYTARDGTEYPYVSTPLSKIGKGYPNILTWLADQKRENVVYAQDVTGAQGEDVVIPVSILGNTGAISSLRVKIGCDKLVIKSVALGDAIKDNSAAFEFNPENGKIVWAADEPLTGDGVLFNVTATIVNPTDDGDYPISFEVIEATDNDVEFIDCIEVGATLHVVNPHYKGDVSLNGSLDNRDIIMIARYLVDLEEFNDEQKLLADYNEDGVISNADLVLIARAVVGLQ